VEILQPQCLVFLLPLLVGVLLIVLNAAGLSGEHGDLHVDHDVDTAPPADLQHDLEHGSEAGHDSGSLGKVLQLMGIGRVPLSILIVSLCFIWGASGLIFLKVLSLELGQACLYAAIAAAVGTRLLAEGIACLIPGSESYSTMKEELVGQTAEVLHQVTGESGAVRLRDFTGNLVDLSARTRDGSRVMPGAIVVLVEYDPGGELYGVEAR